HRCPGRGADGALPHGLPRRHDRGRAGAAWPGTARRAARRARRHRDAWILRLGARDSRRHRAGRRLAGPAPHPACALCRRGVLALLTRIPPGGTPAGDAAGRWCRPCRARMASSGGRPNQPALPANQPSRLILTMAAVVAWTVRLILESGPTSTVLHVPSHGASPVIAAPPRVTLVPWASPRWAPASVMTCA